MIAVTLETRASIVVITDPVLIPLGLGVDLFSLVRIENISHDLLLSSCTLQ